MFHDLERQKKKNETKTTPLSSLSSAFLRPSLFCFLFFFWCLSRADSHRYRGKKWPKSRNFYFLFKRAKQKKNKRRPDSNLDSKSGQPQMRIGNSMGIRSKPKRPHSISIESTFNVQTMTIGNEMPSQTRTETRRPPKS